MIVGGFYTYTLAYPDEYEECPGKIFYVGKGSGDRINQHEQNAVRNVANGVFDNITDCHRPVEC